MAPKLSLDELHRIRLWHVAHRTERPLEYHLWDAVLTVWLMGCMGVPLLLVLDLALFLPLTLVAACSPALYVRWRARAHRQQRLRCDWLQPAA